jgi:hypothetical protein
MNDDSLEGLPIVSRGAVRPGAFVPPTTQTALARRTPVTLDATPLAVLTQAQAPDVSNAWQPLQATNERTSAVDRAEAVQKRLRPFLWLYAGAGVVVGGTVFLVAGTLPGAALVSVLVFSALGVGTYIRLNRMDFEHSGAGVERLRIVEAADLARQQLDHDARLREMALAAYLKHLEKHEGGR